MLVGSWVNAQLFGKLGGGENSSEKEFKSISELANQWEDGAYFKRVEYSGMLQPQGKEDIKFIKKDGEVEKIDIDGTVYEKGKASNTDVVMSYFKGQWMLYLTESSIIQYNMSGSNIYVKAIWGSKVGVGKGQKEIAAYRQWAESEINKQKSEHADAEKERREKEAKERKAKYGLHDKSVKAIEIVNLKIPEKFGHFTNFEFDMKAILNDGSVISTTENNTGYMSDYKVTYKNCTFDNRGLIGGSFIKDDKIIIEVALANDENIKTTKEVVLKYNQPITFTYNGMSWSRGAGESAGDYRIEVKQNKHAVTGKDVLRIKIFTMSGSDALSEFSMATDQTLNFNCNGGNGGVDDNRGNDGGNGGNILLIKDPSVKTFNLNYRNNGGKGGRPTNPNYDGRDGRDGTYKEEVRKVNF